MQFRETLKKLALIILLIIILIVSAIAFYPYVKGPDIRILSSYNREDNDKLLVIKGTANRAQIMEINGKRVYSDSNNEWSIEVPRRRPSTLIEIIATDKFGKKIVISREY